jgi:RNA polymerase sigma factor (sigma-70 family)
MNSMEKGARALDYMDLGKSAKTDKDALKEMVNRAVQGDSAALTELIVSNRDEYYRLAYVYLNNKEDSLDAIQNMTLAVLQSIKQLRDVSLFYSWSRTILVNECKSMLKRKARIIEMNAYIDKNVDLLIENVDNNIFIMNYVDKLSPKLREAIKLHYFLDYDYGTIAEIIDLPVGTVKSRVSKALKRLRLWIGGV